ncbi:choice-of-anchor I family protein [Psychrobacter sp.]|uniref:choice-of-anchor I family protein n=1 Tax=Psychrobacter sp. TaxID=56811 RepID=UPI0025E3AEC8|nr:choice-of-anchor I family protein [Psychrobacter sp.]
MSRRTLDSSKNNKPMNYRAEQHCLHIQPVSVSEKVTRGQVSSTVLSNALSKIVATGVLSAGLLLSACTTQTMSDTSELGGSKVINMGSTDYKSVTFVPAGSYVHGAFDESAAEITAYHPATKHSFIVNAQNKKVDVLDMSDIYKPVLVRSLAVDDVGSVVNSVAIQGDMVALAVQANVKTDRGHVVLYDANTLQRIKTIEVGALPDMVAFTHDGQYLLVANEGEPDDNYKVDAEGSISIINLKDRLNPTVKTATFTPFNNQKAQLLKAGVRIFGKKADGSMSSVAEDLEPEYIAVDQDNKTAYISLQENNAIAIVDIASAQVKDIKALGAKDHSKVGNELDVSNKDDAINITTWPIMGMYMPDSIAYYSVNGKEYIVTANEGDAREWGNFKEEIGFNDVKTDPAVFNRTACHNMECGDKKALGKIDFSASMGDNNGDGIYEALYSFGARSFSIWDAHNLATPVYDSGSFMAKYIAQKYPKNFNASNDKNDFDNRSDNKVVEPEGVTIGKVGSQTIAFVGLERISSVMAFDVTNPKAVRFLGEINTRTFDDNKLKAAEKGSAPANADGDLGPEGLTFISAQNSPSGKPLLLVGFEVSGSSRIFELDFSTAAAK